MILSILVALAIYAAAVAASVALARRFVAAVSLRAAVLLALLPLVFTGGAFLTGRLYGPADLYAPHVPWHVAGDASAPANPILSDLAFANIPWRAAVRDAAANGRLPFWNRFVLAGNPLLASAQAGIFHPATLLGLALPLALSWTFSCTFTIFLGLLAGFLCFRDFVASEAAALLGAVGWGFSTYLLFWTGWSVGPSTATFPLLVLAMRRIARSERHGIALAVTSLLLALAGGHPESLFHGAAAAGVIFVVDLVSLAQASRRTQGALRPLGAALAAGGLALLLSGPQLFPLLAAIPHSAEYRERSARLAAGASSQSVAAPEAARRLLPALLPFAHGIYGRSPVQAERGDGSGMPLAYAGSVLFPFAILGLVSRRRGAGTFGVAAAAGLLLGASAPGLIDVLTKLPGFALSLNYRMVFLAPFGLAGLAALGLEASRETGRPGARRLAVASSAAVLCLGAAALLARPVFRDRALPSAFVGSSLAAELFPLVALAVAAALGAARPSLRRALAPAGLLLLLVQRPGELGGVYPACDTAFLAAPAQDAALLPARAAVPEGWRVVATGGDLRPNGAALLGLEDVRGYESIVLDRFADTYPLWCVPQAASFNRVDDLTRPFLAFLGARFAIAAPDAEPPTGWSLRARSSSLVLFENPRALPRAFAPRRVASVADPLAALAAAADYSETVWIAGPAAVSENPPARVDVRTSGPDVLLDVDAPAPALVATSVPDWPGWRATMDAGPPAALAALVTVNHAFVGVRVPAGRSHVRLVYRPPGFVDGLVAFAAGSLIAAVVSRRRRPHQPLNV